MKIREKDGSLNVLGSSIPSLDTTFTEALLLKGNPVSDKEASTKLYVDSRVGSLNADDIGTDVLTPAILPKFQGGITNVKNTNIFTLPDNGAEEGTYTKVTVGVSGLVLGGEQLHHDNLPELSYSKINKNKPTTTDDYNIQNALLKAGGEVGSEVTLEGIPTENLHIVNRKYLDDTVDPHGYITQPGKIFRSTSTVTPEGHLRCNGGTVSKITYAALYAALGEEFKTLDPDTFKLPDYTGIEFQKTNYYIEY